MKRILLAFLPLFLLASCGEGRLGAERSDYLSTLAYHDRFKILQLADLHWDKGTPIEEETAYLKSIVKRESPDLIVFTGDNVLGADQYVASALYETIDSFGIPYAVTYGNHDYQGTYSPDFMDRLVTNGEMSLTKIVDDAIHGATNYGIEIVDGEETVWRVNLIDSGSLIVESGSYVYDYIRDEQTALYEMLQPDEVPNLLFFHIPLYEWAYAYDANPDGIMGRIGESFSWSSRNEDFQGKGENYPFWAGQVHSSIFEAAKEHNCKGIFVGHDHSNDWVSAYDGIALGYGVKTGKGLYYDTGVEGYPLVGYATYELNRDGSYELSHVFYEEGTLLEHGRESAHVAF